MQVQAHALIGNVDGVALFAGVTVFRVRVRVRVRLG